MEYLEIRELYHYGVKGMKWGVRKDKQTDSIPKKSYSSPGLTTRKTDPSNYTDDELAKINKRLGQEVTYKKLTSSPQKRNTAQDAKKILNDGSDILNSTARLMPTGNGKTVRKNYSHMSDDDLRKKINRLQLEESYGRLTGETKYVKSGSEKAREILQTAGAVIAIGATAAGLASTIIDVRRNKPTGGK